MSLPTALPRELGETSFARANPLARLAPAAALGFINVLSLDAVTSVTTLLLVVLALPLTGLTYRELARTAWPLGFAALTLLVVNTVADPTPGLGASDLATGALTASRLLAIALPGVVAFATIDAVDLTDAIVQQLRLPPRFGYGSLAAMRLMPMLMDDWRSQSMAARARGVAARTPIGRVAELPRRVLLLLVSALRRATRLAVALDARGFGNLDRGSSRPSEWRATDSAWCIGGVLVAAGVTAASVVAGTWSLVLG